MTDVSTLAEVDERGAAALSSARTAYGRSVALWAAHGHVVERDWWMGLSGTGHVDYNQVLLHGEDAVADAPAVLDELRRAGQPAMIMLAGAGLRAAQVLADEGWVCTGAMPFMVRHRLGDESDDPAVRILTADELGSARTLAGSAFGVPPEVAAAIYADDARAVTGRQVWGLFSEGRLVSCVANVVDGGVSVGWALATRPELQREGHGRRLLRAVTYRLAREGATVGLLLASASGRRLYESQGYRTAEHWQSWSRPRWTLGAA